VLRILVDQSGYDLLNIGDVAMLQSCVTRLQHHWPDAEIMVIAHDPGHLDAYCPGTIAIGPTWANRPPFGFLPRKPRLVSEQAWKMAAPNFSGRLGSRRAARSQPCTAIQAVQAADLVVASGGGYVTDTFWWHAVGVLSLLSLAQRLGKPTAMFGQGIGPVGQRVLRTQARAVLPRLAVLGLREGRIGRDLALSLGVPPGTVAVAGDDALELVGDTNVADGKALGANLRVSGYAGVDPVTAAAVTDLVLEAATVLEAPIIALPVSRYAVDADVVALRSLLRSKHGLTDIVLDDITTPGALVGAAASCRAIVTGSYHAAVFGLAQGVPVVCVTKSRYYDAKFGGLQSQFPGACFVVSLDAPDYASRLRAMILQSWHLPVPARAAAKHRAVRLRDAGREAYAQFRAVVENPKTVTADSRELIR
jgi:polysaccharide pyruvyl transferase WcaK-like protein